jgi:Uma2 family endonuclease
MMAASMTVPAAPSSVPRRRFTVTDYHRMAEAGTLGEDNRVELIEGEVLQMAPIGHRHAATVMKLGIAFAPLVAAGAAAPSTQNPLLLGPHNEPQPDFALLRPLVSRYDAAFPTPADVLLVVEVADTSLTFDRDTKLPLYAPSGITEVWLIDLVHERIELWFDPTPQGYRTMRVALRGETITARAFPSYTVAVDALLPVS